MSVIRSLFEESALKKEQFIQKKTYFSYVFDSFWQFFPFFMPKSESLPLLFAQLLF